MTVKQKLINVLISFAFLLYMMYLINDSYSQFYSFPVLIRLSYMPYALLLIFIASILSVVNSSYIFVREFKPLFYLFVFSFVTMLIVGVIRKNPINLLYPDIEGLTIFLSGMLMGSRKENWNIILRVFFIVLLFGTIISFISIFSLQGLERSITEHSLVNKLQGLLFPVYFLFLLYPIYRRKQRKQLVIISIVLLFILSIIFQKRLTFLHVLVTVLLFSYFYLKTITRKNNKLLRNFSLFLLLVFLFSFTVQLLSFAGYDLSYSTQAFYDRAIGNTGFISKVEHDGRYKIAGDVINEIFKSGNSILGYGLGGYISIPNMWYSMYIGTTLMTHTASSIEVGQTWPLWKGGLLFTLVYQLLSLKLIFLYKKIKKNYFLLANWAFLLISYLFFYGEHFWTGVGNLFFLFLLGSSYGVLMAYKKFYLFEP